jgi:hypothetical protein
LDAFGMVKTARRRVRKFKTTWRGVRLWRAATRASSRPPSRSASATRRRPCSMVPGRSTATCPWRRSSGLENHAVWSSGRSV